MGKVTEKLTANKTKDIEVRVYCPQCKREQTHVVFVSADLEISEDFSEDFWMSSEDNYQVIKCKCGNLSFRHLNWFSEYEDRDSPGYTETLYPKIDVNSLTIKSYRHVPDIICRIYEETIKAFNNECFTLCAAGLRAIVEGICAANNIKNGPVEKMQKDGTLKTFRPNNLEGKISGLCEKNILTNQSAEALHEHRFLGNEAVHVLEQPSPRELKIAIEIIEHILEQLFEIPKKVKALKTRRLSRSSKRTQQNEPS